MAPTPGVAPGARGTQHGRNRSIADYTHEPPPLPLPAHRRTLWVALGRRDGHLAPKVLPAVGPHLGLHPTGSGAGPLGNLLVLQRAERLSTGPGTGQTSSNERPQIQLPDQPQRDRWSDQAMATHSISGRRAALASPHQDLAG